MKSGIELIAEERKRQIEVEGWTAEHDAQHDNAELPFAAAAYAVPAHYKSDNFKRTHLWPWLPKWWKPSPNDRVRELAKAGALIAAEIDRIQVF